MNHSYILETNIVLCIDYTSILKDIWKRGWNTEIEIQLKSRSDLPFKKILIERKQLFLFNYVLFSTKAHGSKMIAEAKDSKTKPSLYKLTDWGLISGTECLFFLIQQTFLLGEGYGCGLIRKNV